MAEAQAVGGAEERGEEGELDALAAELSGILGFMDQLAEVDVTGV
ncbi:MAG: aspartyl/glutamyl-tRNA amidotransferase subunit C, partial [Candidatus Bipolaricaulota bacterium]|nr:aspartyl/glutamyl-tRNA amidotransferase subunit C [Candidatus Bipolaricaulota bacterium]